MQSRQALRENHRSLSLRANRYQFILSLSASKYKHPNGMINKV